MRVGIVLPASATVEFATMADRAGLHAVWVDAPDAILLAAEVAAQTIDTRLLVTVPLEDHPVTLAEEISVLDHLSSGRVVVVIDPAGLPDDAAAEDVVLMRSAWTGAWIRHRGERWTVPAGLHGEQVPDRIAVTPLPAQIEMPVWIAPGPSDALAARLGLPPIRTAAEPAAPQLSAPVVLEITGDLAEDRALLHEFDAASHGYLRLPDGFDVADVERYVARYLAPEMAMPWFPRIMSDSRWPAVWPPIS